MEFIAKLVVAPAPSVGDHGKEEDKVKSVCVSAMLEAATTKQVNISDAIIIAFRRSSTGTGWGAPLAFKVDLSPMAIIMGRRNKRKVSA